MKLSTKTVAAILERWSDEGIVTDHCGEYGEPGYSHDVHEDISEEDATECVVLGDYWCRCGDSRFDALHGKSDHHPLLWDQLEAQGVSFEWHDEWAIDHPNDKAYRTTSDSYHWQPSFVWTDDGDMLTADDDFDSWVEWAAKSPGRCLLSNIHSEADILAAEFRKHPDEYENGFHQGQTDEPAKLADKIRAMWHKDTDIDVVFLLDEVSQFYV